MKSIRFVSGVLAPSSSKTRQGGCLNGLGVTLHGANPRSRCSFLSLKGRLLSAHVLNPVLQPLRHSGYSKLLLAKSRLPKESVNRAGEELLLQGTLL